MRYDLEITKKQQGLKYLRKEIRKTHFYIEILFLKLKLEGLWNRLKNAASFSKS